MSGFVGAELATVCLLNLEFGLVGPQDVADVADVAVADVGIFKNSRLSNGSAIRGQGLGEGVQLA